MERVRVFVQHITHAADQLVTVIVALALAAPEMCHLRIGCCPGPFSPQFALFVNQAQVHGSTAACRCCCILFVLPSHV